MKPDILPADERCQFCKRNQRVRQAIKGTGLKHWQIADALGISDVSLSRWLRYELPTDKQADILRVINKIQNTGGDVSCESRY